MAAVILLPPAARTGGDQIGLGLEEQIVIKSDMPIGIRRMMEAE